MADHTELNPDTGLPDDGKREASRSYLLDYTQRTELDTPTGLRNYDPAQLTKTVDLSKMVEGKPEAREFQGLASDELTGWKGVGELYKTAEERQSTALDAYRTELDENQGFFESLTNFQARATGKVVTHGLGGLVGTIYGAGKALITWDSEALFDNEVFDVTDDANEYLDDTFAVYASPEYYEQSGVWDRIKSSPMKVLADDGSDLIGFVGGAITTELAATALAPVTGGASLVAGTARVLAKGTEIFNKGAKTMKVLRGLDQGADAVKLTQKLANAGRLERKVEKFKQAIGTTRGMVTGAGYESALIARETKDRVVENLIHDYTRVHGYAPSEGEINEFNEIGKEAALQAFGVNTMIVGGSNLLQFPKLFWKGYNGQRKILRATKQVDGKLVSKLDEASKLKKAAGFTYRTFKNGFTEAFEEGSQGILEEGLVDYYSSNYSPDANKEALGGIEAMMNATNSFLGSTEGSDSIGLGFFMGMAGIGMPFKIKTDAKTGKQKVGLGFDWYGGVAESIADRKNFINQVNNTVDRINKSPDIKQSFQANYANAVRSGAIQSELDEAVEDGDIFRYKNKEHDLFYSYVRSRQQAGMFDGVVQDIEALEKMNLKDFNKMIGAVEVAQFDEAGKAKVIKDAKAFANSIKETTEDVEALYQSKVAKRKKGEIINDEAVKEQLIHTASSIRDMDAREKNLGKQLEEVSDYNITTEALKRASNLKGASEQMNKLGKVTNLIQNKEKLNRRERARLKNLLAELKLTEKEAMSYAFKYDKARKQTGKVKPATDEKGRIVGVFEESDTFKDAANKLFSNWEANDPSGYALHKEKAEQLHNDLLKLKNRRETAIGLYNSLFTEEGAKKFTDFSTKLEKERDEAMQKAAAEEAKKETKKATTESQIKKAAKKEQSVTGNTKVTDETVDELVDEGVNPNDLTTLKDVLNKNNVTKTNTFAGFFNNLPKQYHAATIVKLKKKLVAEGFDVANLTTVEDFLNASAEQPGIVAAALKILTDILDEKVQKGKTSTRNPIDDQNFSDEVLETPLDQGADSFFASIDFGVKSTYTKGANVTDNSTIIITLDNQIEAGKVQYDATTGQPVENKNRVRDIEKNKKDIEEGREPSLAVIDPTVTNSPSFLSNEQIAEGVEVELRMPKKPFNPNNNQKVTIDIYYGENFIGQLPDGEINNVPQLNALREAVVNAKDNKEPNVKIQLLAKISKHVNSKKVAGSPTTPLQRNINKAGFTNDELDFGVVVTDNNGNTWINATSASKKVEHMHKQPVHQRLKGKVVILAKGGNGEVMPFIVFTHKLGDTKIKDKVLEDLKNLAALTNEEEVTLARKELESNFSLTEISIEPETGNYRILTSTAGVKENHTNLTYEQASEILLDRIVKVKWGKINENKAYYIDNNIITTDLFVNRDSKGEAILTHSSGFVLKPYSEVKIEEEVSESTAGKSALNASMKEMLKDDEDFIENSKDDTQKEPVEKTPEEGTVVAITKDATSKWSLKVMGDGTVININTGKALDATKDERLINKAHLKSKHVSYEKSVVGKQTYAVTNDGRIINITEGSKANGNSISPTSSTGKKALTGLNQTTTTEAVQEEVADIERKKQEALEQKVIDLQEERKALRSEDGSVPDKDLKKFKDLGKKIDKAKVKATRGFTEPNQHISIRVRTEEGGRTLTEEEAVVEEQKIEALIQKAVDGDMTAEEVIQIISDTYAFHIDKMDFIRDYINDRTSDAPKIGNNKESFQAWRRGKYDTEPAALGKEKVEPVDPDVEAAEEDELKNDNPDIAEASDEDMDELFRLTPQGEDGTKWDREQETEWLRKKLGKSITDNTTIYKSLEDLEKYLPAEVYDMLINARKQGESLHGLFTKAALHLNENAFEGTAYHEAFHVVMNLALTKEQYKEIINEAREAVEELAGKTDIDVEEYLADEFMKYVQASEAKEVTIGGKVKNFFKRMYRMLKVFFGVNSGISVARLFEDIQLGVYKNKAKFKNTDLSSFADVRARSIARQEQLRGQEEFNNPIIEMESLEHMRQTYHMILKDIKQSSDEYEGLDDKAVINKIGVGKMNNILLNRIAEQYKTAGTPVSKRLLGDVVRVLTNDKSSEYYTRLEDGSFAFKKASRFLESFTAYLAKDGLKIRLNETTDTQEVFDTDLFDLNEEETFTEAYDRGNIEINPKDSTSQRLKRFFNSIPKYTSTRQGASPLESKFQQHSGGKLAGYYEYEDGSKIFAEMIKSLSGNYTEAAMMAKLTELSKTKPHVYYMLQELYLPANKEIKKDLFIHIASKSYNKFLLVHDENGKFRVMMSNRKDVNTVIREDLVGNALVQNNPFFLKDKKGKTDFEKINIEKVKAAKANLKNVNNVHDEKTVFGIISKGNVNEKFFNQLSKIYGHMNISLTPRNLEELYNTKTDKGKSNKLIDLVNSTVGILNSLENGKNPFLEKFADDQMQDTKVRGDKSVLESLARVLVTVYEGEVISAFRNIEGKSVYNLQQSSYLSKNIYRLKDKVELQGIMDKYSEDPLLSHSPFLKDLLESSKKSGETLFKNLDIALLDGFRRKGKTEGVGYSKMSDIEMEATAIAAFFNDSTATKKAWIKFPIPSDSSTIPFIKIQKLNKEEIVEKLFSVAQGEFARIEWFKKKGGRLKNIPNFKDKAGKFQILNFLNGKVGHIKSNEDFLTNKEEIKKMIETWISTDFLANELKLSKEMGIINSYTLNEDGTVADIKFTENILHTGITAQKEFYSNYLHNSLYYNTQLSTVFSGDPAFYKNATDFQKRNKQVHSPGLFLDLTEIPAVYNVAYLADNIVASDEKFIEAIKANLKKVVDDKGSRLYTDSDIIAIASQYETNNETDGQGIISPKRYRDILKGLNRWTKAHEEAFVRIMKGTDTIEDAVLFPPIKPFVFSEMFIDGVRVPVQHKNSEMMLTKSMAQVALDRGDDKLMRLYDKMNDPNKPIDSVQFESAVKVGGEGIGLDEDGNVEYATIDNLDKAAFNEDGSPKHVLSNYDWRLQQETPPHYQDDTNLFGTQLRQLIISDISMDKEYTIKSNGKDISMSGRELVKHYQEIIATDLKESFEQVREFFENEDGNINYPKLLARLREEVQEKGYGNEYLKALEAIEVTQGRLENGQIVYDIKPIIPLYHPLHSNRIESMINSFFKKGVTRQKVAGGSFINTSSYGLSNNLELKIDKENGIIEMEALLPWWSKKYFPKDENGKIDFTKLPEDLKELIGYRIPTEDNYSIFKIKVVGFTPAVAGGTLILPREVTNIAGLDFDIDKLFIMTPTFTVDSKGNLVKEQYSTDSDELYKKYKERLIKSKRGKQIAKRYGITDVSGYTDYALAKNIKAIEDVGLMQELGEAIGTVNIEDVVTILQEEGNALTETEFKAQSIELQNNRNARDNRKIEIISGILSNVNGFDKFIDGGNFEELKNNASIIRLLEAGKLTDTDYSLLDADELSPANKKKLKKMIEELDAERDFNIMYPSTQRELFRRNMTGKELIGIFANHNTHHAKAQYTEMELVNALEFGDFKYGKLNQQFTTNPAFKTKRISRSLGSKLAAVVDNAKDPISAFLNMNTYTSDAIALMNRLGIPDSQIFLFLNQPIIKSVTKEYFNQKGNLLEQDLFAQIKREWKQKASARAGVSTEGLTAEEAAKALQISEMPTAKWELLEGFFSKDKNEDYYTLQLGVLSKFEEIMSIARELSDSVQASRIDTKGVGPSSAANYMILDKQRRVLNRKDELEKNPAKADVKIKNAHQTFQGVGEFGMMGAFNEHGILQPIELMNKLFYHNKPLLVELKNWFSDQKGHLSLNEKEVNAIQNGFLSFFTTGFDFFSYENNKDLVNTLPDRLSDFKKKNPDSKYKLLLNNLTVIRKDRNVAIDRITYYNTGKELIEQELTKKTWERMLTSNISEEKDLALDLIKYSFLQAGFAFTPFSFTNMIPVEFYTDRFQKTNGILDSKGRTFNHYLEEFNKYLETGSIEREPNGQLANNRHTTRFIDQFMRNNFDKFTGIKSVNLKKLPNRVKSSAKESALFIGYSEKSDFRIKQNNVIRPVQYIKARKRGKTYLYKYVRMINPGRGLKERVDKYDNKAYDLSNGTAVYEKVETLGVTNFLTEYDMGKDIESTAVTVKPTKKVSAKSNTAISDGRSAMKAAMKGAVVESNETSPTVQKVADIAKPIVEPAAPTTPTAKPITQKRTYSGLVDVNNLQPNQVFVFGANTAGGHGGGTAGLAQFGKPSMSYNVPSNKTGVLTVYGETGMMTGTKGSSYGLVTKKASITGNKLKIGGRRSVSIEEITKNISELYETAKANPSKEFLIGYADGNATKRGMNGYTMQEMADAFSNAAPIPVNIVFNADFNKLITAKPATSVTPTGKTRTAEEIFKNREAFVTIYQPSPGRFVSQTMVWNEEDFFYEPYETGDERYSTKEEAFAAAVESEKDAMATGHEGTAVIDTYVAEHGIDKVLFDPLAKEEAPAPTPAPKKGLGGLSALRAAATKAGEAVNSIKAVSGRTIAEVGLTQEQWDSMSEEEQEEFKECN